MAGDGGALRTLLGFVNEDEPALKRRVFVRREK